MMMMMMMMKALEGGQLRIPQKRPFVYEFCHVACIISVRFPFWMSVHQCMSYPGLPPLLEACLKARIVSIGSADRWDRELSTEGGLQQGQFGFGEPGDGERVTSRSCYQKRWPPT